MYFNFDALSIEDVASKRQGVHNVQAVLTYFHRGYEIVSTKRDKVVKTVEKYNIRASTMLLRFLSSSSLLIPFLLSEVLKSRGERGEVGPFLQPLAPTLQFQ